MKVKIYGILKEEFQEESFEFEVFTIKEILSLLNLHKGTDFIKELLENKYYYVLYNEKNPEEAICLSGEIIFSEYKNYNTLLIVPEITGDIPVPLILVAWAGAYAGTVATIFAAVGNMLFALALGAVMQLLSPTPEFSSDPATAQNESNLFNGAPMIRNQGGSVPLIYGNPYCNKPCGVLISSGVSTA